MNIYDDKRALIQRTINSVYTLKCFVESTLSSLGAENDAEKIMEIKKLADQAEREIDENISHLSRLNFKRPQNTPRKLKHYNSHHTSKKKSKQMKDFERYFRLNLVLYNFSIPQSPKPQDLKQVLIDLKSNYKKLFKTVEHFDYCKEDKKFKIRIRFLFGIELVIHSEDGSIEWYSTGLSSDSLILRQLLSLFEIKWDFDLSTTDRDLRLNLQRISRWLEIRRLFYTEKCKICDRHLSFKTGTPLVPLAVYLNEYFHLDCFYDFQKDFCLECY
jgi:hypothetical protein